MTRAPPRLPRPRADQPTFRQPPLPGMTSPANGSAAIQPMNSFRSSVVHTSAAYLSKMGVSTTVRTVRSIRHCRTRHKRSRLGTHLVPSGAAGFDGLARTVNLSNRVADAPAKGDDVLSDDVTNALVRTNPGVVTDVPIPAAQSR
jgi:hypothetical protein